MGEKFPMTLDLGKLLLIGFLNSITVLGIIFGNLDESVFTAVLFTSIGYATGNGLLAMKGKYSQPMIAPRPKEGTTNDTN